MHISVLGLGHMGRALTIRLRDAGYAVTVWNRTPGKAAGLVERGATEASSVEAAVADADVVITLLSNDAAVKQVCLGEEGAIAHLRDGAVLVDMSTVHPVTSREVAAAVPGSRFVDAPILGGPHTVINRKATLLVAGPEEIVRDLDHLWNDLASAYVYTGPNGTATTLKLLSNLILVGGTALLAEAVVTARASGIDTDVVRQVFSRSPAVAPGVQARLDDALGGDHQGWWTLELADKDMTLVLKLGSDAHLRLPLAAATEAMIRRAIDAGYGELDLGAIVETIRDPSKSRSPGH